ncbi:MAG: hypothetical protein Q8Q48_02910 [Candidatus Staskawiczbacteria bacterium]|nr:hypothetical protein [Candidatus Staskawiczbacteria bacterium]
MKKMTPQSAQKIQDKICYGMPHEETMKMFFEVNNKVLSKGMKNVKALYLGADLDPVLLALEFQEYMQENREYYDGLFNKFAWKYLKRGRKTRDNRNFK